MVRRIILNVTYLHRSPVIIISIIIIVMSYYQIKCYYYYLDSKHDDIITSYDPIYECIKKIWTAEETEVRDRVSSLVSATTSSSSKKNIESYVCRRSNNYIGIDICTRNQCCLWVIIITNVTGTTITTITNILLIYASMKCLLLYHATPSSSTTKTLD